MNAIVTTNANPLMPTSMESAIQLAEMMARGKLVPSHLQGSPGDCLMVIEAAMRWGMSPFAVAQCTSVIQGKLMFEGKLVAAALNASGIMSSRLDYEFTGANGGRIVTVRGTLRGETKAREITLSLEAAKTNNQMWTKQPDQQLVYAGTRVWARRYAPEVMLGVYAPEEFEQMREEQFNGTTIEADPPPPPSRREQINQSVPMNTTTTHTPKTTQFTPEATWLKPLEEPDGTIWLKNLDVLLANAQSQEEVVEIGGHHSVNTATANAPRDVRARIGEMLVKAYAKFAEPPNATESEHDRADEPVPEIEIVGQDKMAAG